MSDSVSESELLHLIGEIYDCAVDAERWPATLERLAGIFNGRDVAISLHDQANPGFVMRAQWNIDPAFEEVMLENYPINPMLPAVWYSSVDEPYSVLGTIDEEILKQTQWYANTMARFGYRDSIVSLLAKSTAQFGSFSIQRTTDKPPYGAEDLNLLRKLAPHVRRAVFISDLLRARRLEGAVLSATLELLTVGVLLTDKNGRVLHANGAAERILDDGSVLARDQDRLMARNAVSSKELGQAIANAANGTTLDGGGAVVPLRSEDGSELAAWVLPLDGGLRRDLGAAFAARVAVFLREIGALDPLPAELFVRRYGITQAECRVLLLLVQGMTLQELAQALGVATATARTHLARLFAKTGTQRQTDLVRLAMSALPPAVTR